MSEASEIIKSLKMSDGNIAQAIGRTRVAVLRARLEQSEGSRMLPSLKKLYHLQTGKPYGLVPYVPAKTPSEKKPDIPPLTEEQLRKQKEWDKYAGWQEFQPVAHSVGQVLKGVRGKVVESMLPDGYSLVKTPLGMEGTRIVESVPRPPKPAGKPYWEKSQRQRQRRPRQQTPQVYHRPSMSPIDLALALAAAVLFGSKSTKALTNTPVSQHQPSLPLAQSEMPRYVPTFQYRETQEYVTLSTPKTPRVNSLGCTHTDEREPEQQRVHFGVIPTNRTSPF